MNNLTGVEPGDFAAFLASTRGATNAELTDALRRVVAAVRDTGNKGSISLTIKLESLDGTALSVADSIRVSIPEQTREPSIAYADRNNDLSRNNPNTMPLFEDDVAGADPKTGEVP